MMVTSCQRAGRLLSDASTVLDCSDGEVARGKYCAWATQWIKRSALAHVLVALALVAGP